MPFNRMGLVPMQSVLAMVNSREFFRDRGFLPGFVRFERGKDGVDRFAMMVLTSNRNLAGSVIVNTNEDWVSLVALDGKGVITRKVRRDCPQEVVDEFEALMLEKTLTL